MIGPDDLQLIDKVAKQINQDDAYLPTMNFPESKWLILAPFAIMFVISIPVALIIYMGYKEPNVSFESSTFRLQGIYSINIPISEITKVDTLSWPEMPAFWRTNGFAFSKVNRGHYKTTKDDNAYMNVHSGVNPVIRIVDKQGVVYYINRKNADETRQIFNKIKK
jgi:hypothetical protein